mgnify:CR=1 FL=1
MLAATTTKPTTKAMRLPWASHGFVTERIYRRNYRPETYKPCTNFIRLMSPFPIITRHKTFLYQDSASASSLTGAKEAPTLYLGGLEICRRFLRQHPRTLKTAY